MVRLLDVAKKALSSRGFAIHAPHNSGGNILIVPQGSSDHDAVYQSASIISITQVASGIKIGWDWHEAEVASRSTLPTASSSSE